MLKPKGLLHVMPIPNNVWEDVFVDFIRGLLEAKGADSIMIVIFSIKLCFDGSLDCYKVRLVVLGYRQEFGVDYEETFTYITKMKKIWSILVIVASQCWPLHKMNVKNAFFHYNFKEDIWMKLSFGMTTTSPLNYDHSFFIHKLAISAVIIFIYLFSADTELVSMLQVMLTKAFHMEDLGQLTQIFLNQQKYIQDIISLASLKGNTSVDTPNPMEVNVKYGKDVEDLLDEHTLFRRLV
ncbi:hypothetical protein CR513_11079, partial [Mucuna pruriens]